MGDFAKHDAQIERMIAVASDATHRIQPIDFGDEHNGPYVLYASDKTIRSLGGDPEIWPEINGPGSGRLISRSDD
jgi:hypothetical protein